MVVPALLGYQAVLIFNSLIASTTVYLTYRLLKLYKINYAFFGAIILALQPMFFDLSFRSYAEIFTALLFVIMILLYKKESYFLCGLVCGYIFTVRQEAALIGIFLAFIFYQRKNYPAIFAIGIFPFLFNLFGYFKTGDYLFVITEMSTLGAMDFGGASRGFFHYFKVYIFIIGPVCLTLFLLGYYGFLADTKKIKEYLKKFDIVYVVFTVTFLVQVMLMIKGTNPGTWRYLLHISPLAAFFATVGLNNLGSVKFKNVSYVIMGSFLLIVLAVLSKTSMGVDLSEISEYGKFGVVSLIFLLAVGLFSNDTRAYLNKLSITLILIAAAYLFMSFEPRILSPENIAVRQVAEYLSKPEYLDKDIYVTVQLTNSIILFGDVPPSRREKFIHLNSDNLLKAKKGDIIVWDNHYGYRPEYKNDVKLDEIEKDPDFKIINNINATDKFFEATIFEKIN
jgi:hypothetical protein